MTIAGRLGSMPDDYDTRSAFGLLDGEQYVRNRRRIKRLPVDQLQIGNVLGAGNEALQLACFGQKLGLEGTNCLVVILHRAIERLADPFNVLEDLHEAIVQLDPEGQ